MKLNELLRRLYKVQAQKSRVKQLIQNAFDEIHLLETQAQLLIEDLQKERKKK